MRSSSYTERSLTPQNCSLAKKQFVFNWSLLLVGLLFMLLVTTCDSNPARTQGANDVVAQDISQEFNDNDDNLLKKRIKTLEQENASLKEQLASANRKIEEQGNELNSSIVIGRSLIFLLGLLFLLGGIGLAYFFRNSIRRAYQQWKGIKHQTKTVSHKQPADKHVPKEKSAKGRVSKASSVKAPSKETTIHQKLNSKNDLPRDQLEPAATALPTSTAPAIAPPKVPEAEITTDWEDIAPKSEPEPAPPAIRYSYGPIDGTLKAFGEEDYDERTTFRIEVALDGQTATYTVVDNERQQRNVIENQAAYTEAVEYRGEGEGHYANARIQPGTLQRAGDRWRIVDRLIIDRV